MSNDSPYCILYNKHTFHKTLHSMKMGFVNVFLISFFSIFLISPPYAFSNSAEDLAPATQGQDSKAAFTTGTQFFDDAKISGGIYYFQRDRRRYDVDSDKYLVNLNHASTQINAEFISGFINNHIGFDFAVFASHDIYNEGSPDHEMGFFPWSNPWKPDWNQENADDGVSIYKAALKLKTDNYWAKLGYFQPTGPGVLGVNWSIMPGTYRGVNVGADFGGLSIAFAWADEYKSPWFTETNAFMKNDGTTSVPWLWSAGLLYVFNNGLSLELAYGSSKGHLKNAHFKSKYVLPISDGTLELMYHLYAMDDNDDSGQNANDNFSGVALQHFIAAKYNIDMWTLRLEGTYTRARISNEFSQGQFAYRLTNANGSSKGAYEPWWNARSDWNADDEIAFFTSASRKLDDLFPKKGFTVGTGAAFGFNGRGYNTSEHFKEWAFIFDISYTHQTGFFKDAFAKLHYTEYRNGTNQPSFAAYKNGFQSERDIILMIGFPFSL